MSASVTKIFRVEFSTPIEDNLQHLNFYAVPSAMNLQNLPDLIARMKSWQDENNAYVVFNNIQKVSKLAKTEAILPQSRYYCVLWTRKAGGKYGVLFEKTEDGDSKVVGVWNLIKFDDLETLERDIGGDLQNLQDASLFEDVSLFY